MSRRLSLVRLMAFGGAVALLAAGCSSSTKSSNKVNLSGAYTLSAFSLGGQSHTLNADTGATLTLTATTYSSVGTGTLAQILTDSGTYVARDTATVNSRITGTFSQESVLSGNGATGSFIWSANQDTLYENLGSGQTAVVSTWIKTSA